MTQPQFPDASAETETPHRCCSSGCSAADADSAGSARERREDSESSRGDAPAGTQALQLTIDELCCPTEERVLRKALDGLPGVAALTFQPMARQLTVHHRGVDREALAARIRATGMTPRFAASADAGEATGQATPWARLIVAAALALGAELLGWWPIAPGWLTPLLALTAIGLVGLPTWRKGLVALRHGSLNINALMSVAVAGALAIGHWAEAAMVLVLFTLAEQLEARSLARARRAISGLLDLAPARARILTPDGSWQEIEADRVAPGSRLRVRAGERLALDGEITRGEASLDESPITGESLPRDKSPGEVVYAGTINLAGDFEYRATRRASDTTLARIIHAVEAAQARRAPTQRAIDRFAAVYTPAVFALAAATALLWPLLGLGPWLDGVYRALVLLVIACPCALVISTPVTVVSGLAAAAREGILIKGGVFLEQGHRLAHLALDKTGTLTEGRPTLQGWQALGDTPSTSCARLARALAERSNHPVSRALARGLPDAAPLALDDVRERGGLGMVAAHQGQRLWLGNRRLAREMGVTQAALETASEGTDDRAGLVWLGRDAQLLGRFALSDALRATSAAAVARLKALGVTVSLLSGDAQGRVERIAREAGIEEARGELLPEDKLARLEALSQRGVTAMVGDGINDAPALARADIGIAMGAAGSDVAIETADVALMNDDPARLPRFIELARTTRRLLVQNIALALGIKALFLALALSGQATLWMAVFADLGASLLVVGNGLRILR